MFCTLSIFCTYLNLLPSPHFFPSLLPLTLTPHSFPLLFSLTLSTLPPHSVLSFPSLYPLFHLTLSPYSNPSFPSLFPSLSSLPFQPVVHTGEGDLAQLMCSVEGRPTPVVTWKKGRESVNPDHHIASHNGHEHHSLTISGVSSDDFGEYTCIAESVLGSDNVTVRLTGELSVVGCCVLCLWWSVVVVVFFFFFFFFFFPSSSCFYIFFVRVIFFFFLSSCSFYCVFFFS